MVPICRKLLSLAAAIPLAAGVAAYLFADSPSAQESTKDKTAPGLTVNVDGTSLTPRERLGMHLFFDTRLSEPAGLSCASCHDPARAFTGNNNSPLGVAQGSRPGVFGTRDTPTAMYLATAPTFGNIVKDGKPVPAGGLFWDGRADTLEEQAKGPFFNLFGSIPRPLGRTFL